jgi:hypothetical protein
MTLEIVENVGGLLGPLVQAQPPKFGIVGAVAPGPPTTASVLWQDGRYQEDIPTAALDVIGTPDSGVVGNLQGFVLKTDPAVVAQQESPEYQGTAITFYTRDADGAGSPTATLCLMKLNTGAYRELLASTLTVVTGR